MSSGSKPARYEVRIVDPPFGQTYRRVPPPIRRRVDELLDKLSEDPFAIAYPLRKPLEGKWAVRLDGYRLIFQIELNTRRVYVMFIYSRREAYARSVRG